MISLRGFKLKYFAAVLAVIALAIGVNITFIQSRGFEETTATIVDIEEEKDVFDDEITYWPIVEYSVDGTTYTSKLYQSSSSDSVGKIVTIKYDPENPEVIHAGGNFGIYLIVVAAAILAVVIYSSIKGRQNQEQMENYQKARGLTKYAPHEEGEERELYFITDLGTLKNGHRIEDSSRRVLYEAKMTKFSVAVAHKFDFIDHEHGTTTPHLVGHKEESEWGSILIDDHRTFELDGVDVWKHLKENGISVDTSFSVGKATLVGTRYRILRDGEEIALAEQTSQYPHEEDAAKHKVAGAIPIEGFYRIWTKEKNLDLLFVTLMAFARSGAGDDKGGDFGAIKGTIKNLK